MDKPGFRGQNGSADILSASDIDGVVFLHGPPDTHHASQMDNSVHSAHRCDQCARLANVAPMDHDAALLEPPCVLSGQGENPHVITPILESRDQVPPHEAIAADDENLAHIHTSAFTACP